jgi:glycosyltransferase involved in cell wall biosynthesis
MFHILLPRPMHLDATAAEAEAGRCPRHSMALLARELGAAVHEAHDADVPALDRWRSKLAGPPSLWAAARALAMEVGPQDRIFCTSEAGGLQVAAVCGSLPERPGICVFAHNLDRPRARAALNLWKAAHRVDLFLACSQRQVDFLQKHLGLPPDRVRFVWDHTDTRFFSAGPARSGPRPVIASVGLEQRDYRTLAAATHDLEVDVRISGSSNDAATLARTFPDPMPANMTRQFYAWPELRQLYRDAAVVVVSVRENRYAAGVQSLMEALACGRPVVATATEGLRGYLDERAVVCVNPGDPVAMRAAILSVLEDPAAATALAERAHETAQRRHAMERYVEEVAGHLCSIHCSGQRGASLPASAGAARESPGGRSRH